MNIREDKASRVISIELTSGEHAFVTLTTKAKDVRLAEYMASRFLQWVRDELDDAVDAEVSRLDLHDAELVRKEGG